MDTKIFDYLKTCRAHFEVRHYLGAADSVAEAKDGSAAYLTLGWVRVPLLHLITKNNGVEGEFAILDDYKQRMGALRLKIALNHRNEARPLFAQSTRSPAQVLPLPQTGARSLLERSLMASRVQDSPDGD